ncbi:hypothetical protein Tco_1427663 [Tanacetum coccineum]
MAHKAGITYLKPYSAYSNPQGFIYLDKLKRNRLMCSHELYKFSDSILILVRNTLNDIANNLKLRLRHNTFIGCVVTGSKPINRGLIQAILTILPPWPIGEATKASNLQRIPPGV